MPMRLADIRAETKHLSVPFADGTIEVDYRPNTYTGEKADQLQAEMTRALNEGGAQSKAFMQTIFEVIADWDLLEDDGKTPVPLDEDVCYTKVPISVFGKILQSIQEDQAPPGQGPSGGPSPPRAR